MPNIPLTTVQVPIKVGGVKVPTTYEVMVQPDDLKKYANLDAFVTEKTTKVAIASFDDGADDIPMKSLLVDIDPVQAGSGDPSPDNVRAISGHSAVSVYKRGKNLLQNNLTSQTKNGTTITVNPDKSITVSGTPSAQVRVAINSGQFWVANEQAYISIGTMPTGTRLFCTRTEGATTTYPTVTGGTLGTSGAIFSGLVLEINTTFNGTAFTIYPQIELGSSATAYEPYNPDSQDITIPLGQTVYGGALDVVSGVLTLTHRGFDMGSVNWINYKAGGFKYETGNAPVTTYENDPKLKCSMYKTVSNQVTIEDYLASLATPNGTIYVGNSTYGTDASAFKTAMTGQTIVHKLETPQTVQLTPTEVDTLLGSNNIWADTGDVVAEYRADATLLYEKIMAAIGA